MLPVIAPGYFYSSLQQITLFLPEAVKAFAMKASPSLLLAGGLANAYGNHFHDPNEAQPIIAESQHFHFIICHEPKFLNNFRRYHIDATRAKEMVNDIIPLFDTPLLDEKDVEIIDEGDFLQIRRGKVGKHFVHITFLFNGLEQFFIDFEHGNECLIDIHFNQIIDHKQTHFSSGYVPLKMDVLFSSVQMHLHHAQPKPEPIESILGEIKVSAVIDDNQQSLISNEIKAASAFTPDHSEPEPINIPLDNSVEDIEVGAVIPVNQQRSYFNSINTDNDEKLFDAFIKKSRKQRVDVGIPTCSPYECLTVDSVQSNQDAETSSIYAKILTLSHKSLPTKKTAHFKKAITAPPKNEDTPSKEEQHSSTYGFIFNFFKTKHVKHKTAIRFLATQTLKGTSTETTNELAPRSERHQFLAKTLHRLKTHSSDDAEEWLLKHKLFTNLDPKKTSKTQLDLIVAFKRAIYARYHDSFLKEYILFIALEKKKNKTLLEKTYLTIEKNLSEILITFASINLIYQVMLSEEPNDAIPDLFKVFEVILTFAVCSYILSTFIFYFITQPREIIILNNLFQKKLALLQTQNDVNERLLILSDTLYLASELTALGESKFLDQLNPEAKKCFESFLRITSEQPISTVKIVSLLITAKVGSINRLNIVTGTLISLLTIHGKNLCDRIMKNEVPELFIAVMPAAEQAKLLQTVISSIKDTILELENPQKTTAAMQEKDQLELKNRLIGLMNNVFLIYSLRNTSEPTGFFADFEKEYAAITAYGNSIINSYVHAADTLAFLPSVDSPDIHQCAYKSRLFQCALSKKPALAIDALDRISQFESPGVGLQWGH